MIKYFETFFKFFSVYIFYNYDKDMKDYPYYNINKIDTIRQLIETADRKYRDKTVFYLGKNDEEKISFRKAHQLIRAFSTYLLHNNYRNIHIGLLSENSSLWCLTYYSITCSNNVVIPLDTNLSVQELKSLIKHSDTQLLIYSDKYQNIIDDIKNDNNFSNLQYLLINNYPEYAKIGQDLIDSGNRQYDDITIDKDDLATIVYTSGTMGDKKGVMLTHYNLMSDVVGTCKHVIASDTQILLPLHHTFAWVSGMFAIFVYGVSGHISSNMRRIIKDLNTNRPQNISSVPMMAQLIYDNIYASARKNKQDNNLRYLIQFSKFLLKLKIDLRKTLFKTIHDSLGSNLETIICGGAPLNSITEKGLYDLGINVISGYGISECSPVVAVNRNRYFKFGSVGKPIPCNEVKIDNPDSKGIGEILVKGDNVFKGYYKNEEETKNSFIDGYFKTGDLGYIDSDGFLFITGRKKNLIILSNGENVSAEEIENKLINISEVIEVVVYGENDRITAQIYADTKDHDTISQQIETYNKNCPKYKNIGKIIFRDKPFEKTTTLKIKRKDNYE